MTEYINAIELVLLGMALFFSSSKYTPLTLIAFNLWVQFLNSQGEIKFAYIQKSYDLGVYSYQYANDQLMILYLQFGLTYAIFAGVALFLRTRLSFLAGLVILAQSALKLITGVAVYLDCYVGVDMTYVFDAHFIIDKLFVILYVLIAWMCVYWSRKTGKL